MTHKGAAQVVKAFEKVNFVVFGRLGKSENLGIFTSVNGGYFLWPGYLTVFDGMTKASH